MLNGYLTLGHGPRKLIALSGWFGSASGWGGLPEALDFDEFCVAFVDYRGYGRSVDRAGAYTFEEAAGDVLAVADHLGWQRFSLLGHSMGGMAVQRLLAEAPQRIERLAAVAPVPASGARMDAQRLALFERAVGDLETRRRIIEISTGSRLSAAWSARIAQESWTRSRPEAFAGYLREWAAGSGFVERIAGQPLPVKVWVGEYDPTLTPALMQRTWLQWYPHATLEIVANAGHYPTHEAPVRFATELQAFLKGE
ncbi:alpha/beta hydrolase [Aquabacterium sp. A7-Y]|uniref:alpha/beta fold hydrolase n=1 Tax=Aquabacterium sp. A7-Y TaxID=1349605 RepID=UPI00223DF788|nr:alpha/beta hydrolase [Aquabacterium sp. A7-Y]MCW7538819.1 alpha/beta hydrolase [Aquabacterium sp. A7-Y]